ncbi:MAG: hypothetical protein QOG93_1981 [Gaiellaceae bacterium]|nr:hypothetical protein [Gaiellaceae bacterium]
MRAALALAVVITLVLVASAQGAAHPRVALSVSPAQLSVVAPGARRITVRNDGAEQVVVDVARRAVARGWLQIKPTRVLLAAGRSAVLTLRARLARDAEPGDHRVLVLVTTGAQRGSRVPVRLRLGVRVKVRIPGRIVRHLALGSLRVRRARSARVMFVSVANRGNVTVQLRGQVAASLVRHGEQVGHVRLASQPALAPRARTVLTLRYAGRVRGPVTAVVRVRIGPGVRLVERRYRIRL